MILMLKAKQMFLKCSDDNMNKHFHDSLNIVVILARGRKFVSAKCAQFHLTFTE